MTLAIFDIATLELLSSVIFWAYMTGAVGVVVGVYWEKEGFSDAKRHRGWLLLVWALGAETALAVALHAVDDEIASRQRSVIASQQKTIQQLLAKRRLSDAQKDRIAAAVSAFKPIKFVLVTVPEAEPWDFGMDIAATLKSNGWDWIPCPPSAPIGFVKPMDERPTACTSILDHIQINASPEMEKLARSLEAAIKDPSIIGMDDVRVEISPNHPTMVIMVGTKR